MIAAGLQILRKDAKVECATLEALICSGHKDVEPGDGRVWIELTLDTTLPAKISVDRGRSLELTNPTVEQLLKVIDEFV
jgi:hypothetical protein